MASVLVVEDNDDLRDMYQEILSIDGHGVRAAETAAEALHALAEQPPEVLILDLGIAGGIDDVLKTAAARRLPVILASGARDLPERAAAAGAAYLLKPFGPEQLLDAVRKVAPAG